MEYVDFQIRIRSEGKKVKCEVVDAPVQGSARLKPPWSAEERSADPW